MSETQKYCKDCVHLLGNRNYKENWEGWRCDKTKAVTGFNLVTGDIVYSAAFCDNVRKGEEFCGPEGKWYEEYIKIAFFESEESKQLTSASIGPPHYQSKKRVKVSEEDLNNL